MRSNKKSPRRRIDGVFLLDKPYGMSSNTALQKVRTLFNAEKAGHTGTLDPLATGLLPICLGEATKFSADLLEADKEYEATLHLGLVTNTGDKEGEVLAENPVDVAPESIETVLDSFRGSIQQKPPMFSALKFEGKTLYQLARKGIEVERPFRDVEILHLAAIDFDGTMLRLRVRCSKGTYIRTLAEDIGQALGCGACLADLRRTGVGRLSLDGATTLEALAACSQNGRDDLVAPVDTLVDSLLRADLSAPEAKVFCHGNPVVFEAAADGFHRVYTQERFLGVGISESGWLKPKRLLHSPFSSENNG